MLRRWDLHRILPATEITTAVDALPAWPLQITQVRPVFRDAWRNRANLIFPDAVYVALAKHLRAPLLTDGGPAVVATRGITIGAAPARVWPWLAQMGTGRGGFYSYTWIENLAGLGIRNAAAIVPELQYLAQGDRMPLSSRLGLLVRECDPPRSLVLQLDRGGWAWAFHLTELSARPPGCWCAPAGAAPAPVRRAGWSSARWPLRR